MDSDHGGEEAQVVEAGGDIETLAERELQPAYSEDLRRETEDDGTGVKCQGVELRQRLAKE